MVSSVGKLIGDTVQQNSMYIKYNIRHHLRNYIKIIKKKNLIDFY